MGAFVCTRKCVRYTRACAYKYDLAVIVGFVARTGYRVM